MNTEEIMDLVYDVQRHASCHTDCAATKNDIRAAIDALAKERDEYRDQAEQLNSECAGLHGTLAALREAMALLREARRGLAWVTIPNMLEAGVIIQRIDVVLAKIDGKETK